MKLIVGLGNPGRAYRDTRHNVGFMALDRVAADLNASFDREKYKGLIARVNAEGQQVMLLKPMTFMNVSGESVALAARNRVNEPADLLVVLDASGLVGLYTVSGNATDPTEADILAGGACLVPPSSVPALGPLGIAILLTLLGATAYWRLRASSWG